MFAVCCESKAGSHGRTGGSFTQPHSNPSVTQEIWKSVLLPIPGQLHPAVGNNTLPLPRGSDRTLKCPKTQGSHSCSTPLAGAPLYHHIPQTPSSDLAWVADDNMKQLRGRHFGLYRFSRTVCPVFQVHLYRRQQQFPIAPW